MMTLKLTFQSQKTNRLFSCLGAVQSDVIGCCLLIVIRSLRGIWSLIDTLGVRMQDVSRVNKKIICNLSKKYLCEDIKVERQNDTYSCDALV